MLRRVESLLILLVAALCTSSLNSADQKSSTAHQEKRKTLQEAKKTSNNLKNIDLVDNLRVDGKAHIHELKVDKKSRLKGDLHVNRNARIDRKLYVHGKSYFKNDVTFLGNVNGVAGAFDGSYGQLSISSQDITFYMANTWLPIPFNSTGPSSNMSVSATSPATITIQQAGVYQVNFSLYFSVEDSDEDTFTVTTYTLGLNVNGVTTPVAAVYAGEPGHFSLNYNNLMEFSANDYVQFYMEASAADGPTFSNNITLENGNAHLIQISN